MVEGGTGVYLAGYGVREVMKGDQIRDRALSFRPGTQIQVSGSGALFNYDQRKDMGT